MMRNLLVLAVTLASLPATAQTNTMSGFSHAGAATETSLEEKFDSCLQPQDIDHFIRDMSAYPHHVGSAGDKAVEEYIYNKYKSWGFDTRIDTYYVLFPTPRLRVLEMTEPVRYKALLAEPPLKEDATSDQTGEQLPTYNCYSPDGDVTAELVFVNYGLPEDYDFLQRLGIDVKGKIVIAKYGHSWRGIKPKVAQEHGAIGCILYSDPGGDGYYQGDVYPEGPWKNKYGVQRGSVMDMPIYPGDPLTPGYAATKEAKRLDRKEATNLLKIPVLPISYSDAEPLLRALQGPVAPPSWRGALPFTYHIGPGKSKVHLKLAFNWDIKPIHDIIATLKGNTYPDEWVIRGNHYDAWVNGAADPISGQAALLEEAQAVGRLAQTGWRPKRTLVYCAWDGEEPALLGSTEWVEDHAAELQQKAVIYINSDGNGRGFLGAGGSHALQPFLNEVAADVTDPEMKISVLERSRAHALITAGTLKAKKDILSKKTVPLGALGSGSDYSPFFQHLGIPSLNLGFGGEDGGGEYHSIYDSYDDYRRFKDPTFGYGVALAKTAGRCTLRMANAGLLPFDYNAFYETAHQYVTELGDLLDEMREKTDLENRLIKDNDYTHAGDPTKKESQPPMKEKVPYLNMAPLLNAMSELEKATTGLSEALVKNKPTGTKEDSVNKALYRAEQHLLSKNGLPRRPWYRHTIYAPGFYTGYGVKTFPGIREAIEQRNWKEAQEQEALDAVVIGEFARYLTGITESLQ